MKAIIAILAVTIALSGCALTTHKGGDSANIAAAACLSPKLTGQTFEIRNLEARPVIRSGRITMVYYACVVTDRPEGMQRVAVSFRPIAVDTGAEITSNGQQLYAPTSTNGGPAGRSVWLSPVGAEVATGRASINALAPIVEATVRWLDQSGKPREERFFERAVPVVGLEPDSFSTPIVIPDAPGDRPIGCVAHSGGPVFNVSNVRVTPAAASGRIPLYFDADLANRVPESMTRLWATFTAFDRDGNYVGSDGNQVGSSGSVPASAHLHDGFGSRLRDIRLLNPLVLVTLQWHDTNGCQWNENHLVNGSVSTLRS